MLASHVCNAKLPGMLAPGSEPDYEGCGMGMIATKMIEGPTAWRADDFRGDDSWMRPLSPTHILEIEQALSSLKSRGLSFPNFTKEDFELPTLSAVLAGFMAELETGPGFMLVRNIPVEKYDDDEIDSLYWGLGLHMGKAVRQNPAGDLIGQVMNVGNLSDRQTRVYETNAYLPYHTDPTDVVGLLCVRKAKSGGTSSLVSSTSLYNEILTKHPEYLSCLYRPMFYPHLGGDKMGQSPIFSYHKGLLSCRYLRQYLELGHEMMEAPLSPVELEAFDIIDAITQDKSMRQDMMMAPGDLQLVNNYCVMHSRTSFEDFDDANLRRKKLRLWLRTPLSRELGYEFPGRDGFPAR